MDFIELTGLTNFPDAQTPEQDFLDYTHLTHGIIRLYEHDIEKAAKDYRYATQAALTEVDKELSHKYEEVTDNAISFYIRLMKENYYKPYIQHCRRQLANIKDKSSAQTQYLYRAYDYAALNAERYVDHTPLLSA